MAFVGLELILQLYDRLSEYVGFTILVLGNIITWKNYVNANVWSINAKKGAQVAQSFLLPDSPATVVRLLNPTLPMPS